VHGKSEVAPEQQASADHGEPVKMATIEAREDVSPSAASDPENDLKRTEITTDAATESPVEPVGQDRPEPIGAATASKNKSLFTVQVGAFHTKAYADAKLEELKILGYPAYLLEVMDRKQLPLYLVCFGRFPTLAEAGDSIAAFKEKEKMPAVVYRTGSW
jgi:cell division septation protein DedD